MDIKLFDWKKIRHYLLPIELFIEVFFVHIAISQFSYFCASSSRLLKMYDLSLHFDSLEEWVCLFMILPFFYTLVRLTTIYDDYIIPRVKEKKPVKFFDRLKFVFMTPKFLLEFLGMAILWCAIPIKHSYSVLWEMFLRGNEERTPVFLICFLALMFVFFVLGKTTAVLVIPRPKVKAQAIMRDRIYLTKKDRKGDAGLYGQLFTLVVAFWMLPIALIMAIPLFVSFFLLVSTLVTWQVIVFFAVFVVAVIVFWFLRAVLKRRKFVRMLNQICAEQKLEVSKIKNVYKSIFTLMQGEDFTINVGGVVYSCKILSAKRKRLPMYFTSDGYYFLVHNINFFRVHLFSYNTTFKFGYDSPHKKILIINPVPNELFSFYNGQPAVLDNGDIIGGYKIFSASGFLNAVERDCIER